MSRAEVLLSFSESPEHVLLTAPSWLGGVRYVGYVGSQPAPVEDAFAKDHDALVSPLIDDGFVATPEAKHDGALVSPSADHAQGALQPTVQDLFLHMAREDQIRIVHDAGGVDAPAPVDDLTPLDGIGGHPGNDWIH